MVFIYLTADLDVAHVDAFKMILIAQSPQCMNVLYFKHYKKDQYDAVTFNMGLCSLTLAFMQFKLLKSEIHLSLFDLFLFLHSLTRFHRCILHVQLNSIDCLMYEED